MTTTVQPDIDLEELFVPNGQAMKTVRHYARRLVKLKIYPESELDDVEQELTLRLLRRIRRFQAERSCIATFVDRAVRFEALEIFRTRCQPKQVRERKTRSLDAITIRKAGHSQPLSEAITREAQVRGHGRSVQDDIDQVDLRQDMAQAIESLPADLGETCRHLLSQPNPTLAVKRLPAATRERLRAHFEAIGLQDYL